MPNIIIGWCPDLKQWLILFKHEDYADIWIDVEGTIRHPTVYVPYEGEVPKHGR